ncbi:MAG TPA: hypothetical protein VGH98_15505 [Gemmatimonadaceae bacterium]|jgi:hypothetical protein
MGGAPVVIVLVGMLFPIFAIILAILFDVLVTLWLLYQLWHDEWSVQLWRGIRRIARVPHWHPVRNH